MKYPRAIKDEIKARLFRGRAILITGARQVGKTTLVRQIITESGAQVQELTGDDPSDRQLLEKASAEQLVDLSRGKEITFIDEAQRIPHFGVTAKLWIDQMPDHQLIISGSSAFELNQMMQEPLTGRKWAFQLHPISWGEFEKHHGMLEATRSLERLMIYGMYPAVRTESEYRNEVLTELAESYLFKDLLQYSGIRKPDLLIKLSTALAYQIGQLVSHSEVAQLIGSDPKTVKEYVHLLEQTGVVFRLTPFSKNLRNEIKKQSKVYFWDIGMRNALIRDFRPLAQRSDLGSVWENFIIAERMKLWAYQPQNVKPKPFFWRTAQGQEVDYLEENANCIDPFEIKWKPGSKARLPKPFQSSYDLNDLSVIDSENFRSFLEL